MARNRSPATLANVFGAFTNVEFHRDIWFCQPAIGCHDLPPAIAAMTVTIKTLRNPGAS